MKIVGNRRYINRALAQRVLAVAVMNDDIKDFGVYVDAVPGVDHDEEQFAVALYGAKQTTDMAKAFFPHLFAADSGYTWRA